MKAAKLLIQRVAERQVRAFDAVANEQGSALVEFGMSVSVLLTVVIGITWVCAAFYDYSLITNASREATRYAMVRGLSLGSDCTAPGYATCIAQASDIRSYLTASSLNALDPAGVGVSADWLNSDGSECGTEDSCKAPGNIVRVTVSYAYPWPLFQSQKVSLSSSSQMVIVQ